ncbi:MAG: sulfotransferase family protein [Desulfobacteraceae bacterium]|nr:sulfotransferase family protein [Desulfobacteraceae bacterium]
MEIIGAGFGRTGTNSLKIALERLGFGPCYHMFELAQNPSHIDFWNLAIDGKPVNWKEFFHAYDSAVDWPTAAFLPELLGEYPEAKVILTVREPEEWYRSIKNTVFIGLSNGHKSQNPATQQRMAMGKRLILDGVFSGKYKDEQHCLNVYKNHVEDIKKLVPPERLLSYNLSQGWDPLCKFLDVKVPDQSLPHTNTRADFFKNMPG